MEPISKKPNTLFITFSVIAQIFGASTVLMENVPEKYTISFFAFAIIFLLNYLIKYK